MGQVLKGLVAPILMLSVATAVSARAQQVQVSPANRTISITATESAERRADMATLHIGYKMYAPDSAAVYAEAARVSNAIMEAVERIGVDKNAISSDSQSTGQSQEFMQPNLTPEQRAQRRYEAEQSWTVKCDPQTVAKVLAAAVDAGANESGMVDWTVDKEASLAAEASAKALERAREIAAEMAKGLGARVGNLLYASNQGETVRPIPILRAMAASAGAAKVLPKLALSPPMIIRTETVSAIFAVE